MTEPVGEIRVRPGDPSDLPVVAALERRSFSDPWTPASLLGELQPDPLRIPLVAEVDGRVRGYLMAWRVVDQLHILNLATDPDFRRRGLAGQLLATAARQGLVVHIPAEQAGIEGVRPGQIGCAQIDPAKNAVGVFLHDLHCSVSLVLHRGYPSIDLIIP